MTIRAVRYDLEIPRGRYWSRQFALQDPDGNAINLTGYTVAAQVRESLENTSAKIVDLVASHNDAGGVVTLTNDDSGRTLTAKTGYWDLVLTDPSGHPVTYLWGRVDFVARPTD